MLGGSFLLNYVVNYPMAIMALVLLGAGVAAGFPVILGLVGDLYARVSGTAFSLVFVIAIIGNIIWNYLMGHIANVFGFEGFPPFVILSVVMLATLLYIAIVRISNKPRV